MRVQGYLLGLLLVAAGVGCGERESEPTLTYLASGAYPSDVTIRKNPPNLILIVIDSLRADALPLDEDDRPALRGPMPHLATLARRGACFTEASANASWTLPSMTSVLTGRLPSQHGLFRMHPGERLLPDITTFAEVLRATGGYETAAFVSSPWFLGEGESILQGFDTVGHGFSFQGFEREFDRWERFRNPTRPFFLVLHTYDAHMPYGPSNHPFPHREPIGGRRTPEEVRDYTPRDIYRTFALDYDAVGDLRAQLGEKIIPMSLRYAYEGWQETPDAPLAEELREAYWEGVSWTDGLLQRALARIEARGLLKNTLLVVTSDHGETFGEHGTLGHGLQLHDDLVHVPLVMSGPPPFDAGTVVDEPVALLDVLPTFLEVVGLPPLGGGEGRSLLPVLSGQAPGRAVISEEWLSYENTGTANEVAMVAARTPYWKYILSFDRNTGSLVEQAFDLLVDPEELEDQVASRGTAERIQFDDVTCAAVERIRDRVWGPTESPNRRRAAPSLPYASGTSTPHHDRPRPCGGSTP